MQIDLSDEDIAMVITGLRCVVSHLREQHALTQVERERLELDEKRDEICDLIERLVRTPRDTSPSSRP